MAGCNKCFAMTSFKNLVGLKYFNSCKDPVYPGTDFAPHPHPHQILAMRTESHFKFFELCGISQYIFNCCAGNSNYLNFTAIIVHLFLLERGSGVYDLLFREGLITKKIHRRMQKGHARSQRIAVMNYCTSSSKLL